MRAGRRRGRQMGNLAKREASAPIYGGCEWPRDPSDRRMTSAKLGLSPYGDDFK